MATLFGSTLMLKVLFIGTVTAIFEVFYYCFARAGALAAGEADLALDEILTQCVVTFAKTAGPMLLITVVTAVVATFAQTRMLVAPQLLKPKFSRINPMQGFKRLFSMRSVVEAAKGIIKIVVLLYLIYSCVRGMIDDSANFLYMDVNESSGYLFKSIFSLMLKFLSID